MTDSEYSICPYEAGHVVLNKRFVRHLLKCRKNHRTLETAVCPFNARHVIPKPELQRHLNCCPDSVMLELQVNYERLCVDDDELKGDTSVPPYDNHGYDFGTNENWDAQEGEVVLQKKLLPEERLRKRSMIVQRMKEKKSLALGDVTLQACSVQTPSNCETNWLNLELPHGRTQTDETKLDSGAKKGSVIEPPSKLAAKFHSS